MAGEIEIISMVNDELSHLPDLRSHFVRTMEKMGKFRDCPDGQFEHKKKILAKVNKKSILILPLGFLSDERTKLLEFVINCPHQGLICILSDCISAVHEGIISRHSGPVSIHSRDYEGVARIQRKVQNYTQELAKV